MRIGPSGNGPSFIKEGHKSSVEAPAWLNKKGLTAYEYSFGKGFTMKIETAKKIGEEAKKNNILVSVHAPYYINLANPEREKILKSFNYLLKSFEYLRAMGGQHLVVHIGSQMKLAREKAIQEIKINLSELIKLIYMKGFNDMYLCPETMGKYLQIGSYKEIIDLCKMDKILIPTFDFGHINSTMQGELKTKEDYKKIFDYGIEKLGFEKIKNCHIHFSKIEFGPKGEIRHLNLNNKEYGPDFTPLAKVIDEYKLTPTIICESKEFMVEDAVKLKEIYENIKKC